MAQGDIACEAEVNRTSVPLGGEVVLTVSAHGKMRWSPQFVLPALGPVRVAKGRTSQSMSVVNGVSETSVVHTYYLTVSQGSSFTIGPVKVVGTGGECMTEPIAITVTASVQAAAPVVHPRTTASERLPVAGHDGEDIFVTMTADHTEAWVGQQIVLSFRYWRRIQPWSNPSYTPPRTEGFWREDLGSERNFRQVRDGRAYNVTEIRYAVFPTRSGELTIESAELSFSGGGLAQLFQRQRTRSGPQTLRTMPVTIKVKDLPAARPDGFTGVVASSLTLVSEVDRDTVPRGEALGVKVTLVSDGFLKGFGGLHIPAPDGATLHDAGETYQVGADAKRLIGRITMDKVVVPNEAGMLSLPAVELVWFDAGAGRFRTARTKDMVIAVGTSDLPHEGTDGSGFLRNELARLGDDLAFIHPVPTRLSHRTTVVIGRGWWWFWLAVPCLSLAGFKFYLDRFAAARRDPAGRRRRAALATARATLNDPARVPMEATVRAICGYVADCENRPLASVGPDDLVAYGIAVGADGAGRQLARTLAVCDAARFGQQGAAQNEFTAAEVLSWLAELEAKPRAPGAPGTSTIALLALYVVTLGVAGAFAADEGADPLRLLAEGNQAYTEGHLEAAESKYVAAQALGANDAVLHFNLGNTYARQGHLGLAVASYLRAQRLAPRDADIRTNLRWVRGHIRDLKLSDGHLPPIIDQIAIVVRALTLDQWGALVVVLVWTLAAGVAWSWSRGQISSNWRRALLANTAVLVLVVVVAVGRWYVEEVRELVVITAPEAVVRSGPAENFPSLFEVHDGLTMRLVGRRDAWVRVGLGGSWDGWIPASSVVAVSLSDLTDDK